MKKLLFVLMGAVMALSTLTASETFVYTQESYQLLPREFNILRAGDAMCAYESTSSDTFFETNAKNADCLTDGAIYFVSGYQERTDDRYLVRKDDTFTCRFIAPKRLDDVRFWTYWPDGARTDITVASIDVTYDGKAWVTLSGSEFSASVDESSNTISPFLGSNKPDVKARCVRFDNDSGAPLADNIRGIRIVFGPQEINYTAHWELEAKGGECYSGDTPVVSINEVLTGLDQSGERATATVSGYLLSVGSDSSKTATLAVRWGTEEDQLNTEKALEGVYAVNAPLSVELTDLVPGSIYYVRFDATVGDSVGSSEAFHFLAGPEPKTLIEVLPFDNRWENIENTQFGLDTNLPGGNWVCGGGWQWSQPKADKDHLATAEEKAGFAVPLISTETYQKPSRITVSAVIAHSQGGGGVGFWHEMQPRSKSFPLEGGGEEVRIYDATVGFTGIAFNPSQKTLCVYEAGVAVGDPVEVVTTGDKDYHTLTYTVNVSDGSIEWVMLNDRLVKGLVSTAFTDANTDYVGILSLSGGRTDCRYMVVSEGKDPPVNLVLDLQIQEAVVFIGNEVHIPVKAMNSLTEAEFPVNWLAPNCSGATLANGEFVWTATELGSFTVQFSASHNLKTVTGSSVIYVYPHPPAEPSGMKTIIDAAVDLRGQHQDIRFAGTDQVDATDRTDLGLSVNSPGSSWIWNSGWDYGVPIVYAGSTQYDLANEWTSVLLSLQSTEKYTKPTKMFVSTSFTYSGRGVCGFWSGLHDTLGQDTTGGFTGLCFERPTACMKLYVNGAVVGEARRLEFPVGMSQCTLRFVLDIKKNTIKDIVFNGFPVGDFELPGFSDALASYVGIGVTGNFNGENSRLQFQSFRVDGESKSGMIVLFR